MIEIIHIKNFRGIKDLKLDNLGQINIIAGKNNTSKSSILEALALSLSAKDGQHLFTKILREILLWRGLYGEKSIYDLFYKNSKEIEVKVKFLEQEFINLTLKTDNQSFVNKGITIEFEDGKNHWRNMGFNLHLIEPNYISSVLTSAEITQSNFEFITSLTLMKFGYIESLYSQAYESQVLQQAIELLKKAYPEVKSLSPLQKYNKWIMHVETEYGVFPYYVMGEGFKSALIIALLTSMLKNGYLLIDSAEAFHHPSSLEITSKMLIESVKNNNIQVFLTTHSLELIDLLLEHAMKEDVEGRLIYMRKDGENLICSIESFENVIEMRETLGIDLRG